MSLNSSKRFEVQVRLPWYSMLITYIGVVVVVSPYLVFILGHRIWPKIPAHVPIMTYLLVSSFGLAICLVAAIVALLAHYWAE